MDLAGMLQPLEVAEFLDQHWSVKAASVRGTSDKFAELMSWSDLNDALSRDLDAARIKLSRRGTIVPLTEIAVPLAAPGKVAMSPKRLAASLAGGCTLIVNGIEQHVPNVHACIRALSADFGERVHANLYCSWPGSEGFGLHFDGHEVLVAQIEGCKRWEIFPATLPWPLETMSNRVTAPVPDEADRYLDVTLRRGDFLYVPRGHWHRTQAQGGPSLHISFGISRRNGLGLLEWLGQLFAQEAEWRRPLPLGFGRLPATRDERAVRACVEALCARLAAFVADGKAAELLIAGDRIAQIAQAAGPITLPEQVCSPDVLQPDTELNRTEVGKILAGAEGYPEVVAGVVGSTRYDPTDLRCVRSALERERTTVADLGRLNPELDHGRVLQLAADLVRSGAFRLLPPDQRTS